MLCTVDWVGCPDLDQVGDRDDGGGRRARRAPPPPRLPRPPSPAAQIVGIVNCPAAMASGVSASIVARMPHHGDR